MFRNGYEWLWRLEREWKRRLLCFWPGRRLIVSEKTKPGSYLPRSLSKKKKIQRLYKMAMSFLQKDNWWPSFPLQTTAIQWATRDASLPFPAQLRRRWSLSSRLTRPFPTRTWSRWHTLILYSVCSCEPGSPHFYFVLDAIGEMCPICTFSILFYVVKFFASVK